MRHAPVPAAAAALRRGRRACTLVLVAVAGLLTGGARAELLGTHPHRTGTVHLMTELCRANDQRSGQRARQTVSGRQGCWGVDHAGNPVVTWRDGSELVLDGNKVRLSPRMSGLLERAEASRRGTSAKSSAPTPRPPAPGAVAPGRRDFARPAWCPNARFPHERLVCADAQLAARDLQLASLWFPYRRTLSRGAEAWHKSDYFRRLKACGADKACIAGEQATQMRRYRGALPAAR